MRWLAVLSALLASFAAMAVEPATLAEGQVLRGRFVQERHLQGFAQPVRSEGSFLLAPGRGLIWAAEQPFAVTTVVTAAGLVQSVGGAETVRLAAARLPVLSRLHAMMAGALAGDWRALEAEFEVIREPAGPRQRIILTPRRAQDNAPSRIVALVGRFVDEVDIERSGGDRDHLAFNGQVLSAGPLRADEAKALAAAAP